MTTALITGASRGLGREIAILLAKRGYRLVLNARGEEPLRELARSLDTEVHVVAADVSEDAERIAGEALARFGTIAVLINNASDLGPTPMPLLENYPWDELLRVYRINVVAPIHLTQLLLPQMKSRRSGVIVNITSDAGVNAYPGWGGYGSSKAALEHASRTFAAELEGSGVRVLVVDPGDMDTAMHRAATPDADFSTMAKPDAVAPVIVDLLDRGDPFARIEVAA
ncbi:MAG TPA: SDR family oxidoreductase [Thermoanaerobaculia bacterium]|nr:SDR family oxidoreductase [Thermoanaerobaculia bacterium]